MDKVNNLCADSDDMSCPGCGSEIQEGDKYCRVCGRDVAPSIAKKPLPDGKAPIVLTVVIVLALAAIVGVVMTSDGLNISFSKTITVNGSTISGEVANEVTLEWDGTLTYDDGDEQTLWMYRDTSGPRLEEVAGFYMSTRLSEHAGASLALPPGDYEIILYGEDGEIYKGRFIREGPVTRHYEWSAIIAGESRTFSLDHTYPFSEYARYAGSDIIRNMGVGTISKYVVTDGSIGTLSDSLEDAYLRVMGPGSSVDGQDYADYLLSFVQCCFTYPDMVVPNGMIYYLDEKNGSGDTLLRGQEEYWMFPHETIHLGSGDCEDTSFLLASLYSAAGFDSALINTPGHMLVAVVLEDFMARPYSHGYVYTVKALEGTEERIYFCETTTESFVPAGYVGPSVAEDIDFVYDVVFIEGVE